MKFLITFEEFTDAERQEMIDNGETYLYKKIHDEKYDAVVETIRNEIKKLDSSVFRVDKIHSKIIPDEKFFELINKLNDCKQNKNKINIYKLEMVFSIQKNACNLIDLDELFDLPFVLRKLGIGIKSYKNIAKEYDFITSERCCSENAKGLWYNLICDKDFYSFTSNAFSGIIYKNIENNKLMNILYEIKKISNGFYNKRYGITFNDIKLDNKLIDKINEIGWI